MGMLSPWLLLRSLQLAASSLLEAGFLSQEREIRRVDPSLALLGKTNVLSARTSQKRRARAQRVSAPHRFGGSS